MKDIIMVILIGYRMMSIKYLIYLIRKHNKMSRDIMIEVSLREDIIIKNQVDLGKIIR